MTDLDEAAFDAIMESAICSWYRCQKCGTCQQGHELKLYPVPGLEPDASLSNEELFHAVHRTGCRDHRCQGNVERVAIMPGSAGVN
jgi:hypothetical protein